MLASPLLIGGLINLSQTRPASASVPLTFTVVAAIWFGLTNSVREVVRDRKLYVRERLLGVRPTSYLVAKVVTFGLIGLFQVTALWVVVRYGNLLPSDNVVAEELAWWNPRQAEVLAVLWGCYLGALGLGLIISTLASSEEWAVAMLPLAILPQLLLTGVATGTGTLDQGGWFWPLAKTMECFVDSPKPAPARPPEPQQGPFTSLDDLLASARAHGSNTSSQRPSQDRPVPTPVPRDWRWWVEGASVLTYSRPALDLLHRQWSCGILPDRKSARLDALHLVSVVFLTAAAGWLVFRWRERVWLDRT
jgi:hypothetical protein